MTVRYLYIKKGVRGLNEIIEAARFTSHIVGEVHPAMPHVKPQETSIPFSQKLSEIFKNMHLDSGHGKAIISHIAAASFVGAFAAAASHYRRQKYKYHVGNQDIIPLLDRTESGRVGNLERFSHYVEAEPESLYVKLVEEFDRCILSYFTFHWSHASLMISQVLSVESEKKTKLKDFIMAATRKQRFEKVTKDLKMKRVFSTLVEEMKAIRREGESHCTDVMVPAALSERSPVLLLMGGGAATNAVVVEADAFKETDVIYRALSSKGHHEDMLQTAELVHQSSTDAASSLLVTALNEGRDVIMDGTLSWVPFVEQTIAMARNVHKSRYRMGVGYKVNEDGTVTENYWEQVKEGEEDYQQKENGQVFSRKPYRIELVGVVCDAYLAVVRGIRRAIMVKRAVRVNSQLKSHKRFANAFRNYCELVDNARLYCTNAVGGPPRLIAWKDGDSNLLVDSDEIKCLTRVGSLNADADSVYELHSEPNPIFEPGSVWNDIVLCPSRAGLQLELRTSIKKIENY
ncbi:calmodulin calcium-dependent NAD kinase [Citrus sinensis]|nr:calmodulin calcium-dependent NAD kinase [Citrus sinensis]